MSQIRVMGRAWYLAALIPAVVGVVVAVSQIGGVLGAAEAMPRVVVPGKGEVRLAAGSYVVFGERQSTYQGTTYLANSLSLTCTVRDPASDVQPELAAPSSHETYEMGTYAGQSIYRLQVPRAGTFQVACDGSGGPTTIAFGTSLIAPLFIGIGAAMGGLLLGGAVFTFVFVRRRKRLTATR